MSAITIKKATVDEAAILSVLGQVTFMETYKCLFDNLSDLITYCQESFTIERLIKDIKNDNNLFLVVYANNAPIGYAKARLSEKCHFINSNKTAQIERLYLLKNFVGHGAGNMLKNRLLKVLKELNNHYTWLYVSTSNHNAIKFYKRHGFSIAGKDFFEVGKEKYQAFTMTKKLNGEKL